MIVFPSMIAEAAAEAGMKVPVDPEAEYDPAKFMHWHVYCSVQLGCPVTWGNHWENAKIIAKIPDKKIKKITYGQLVELGFSP